MQIIHSIRQTKVYKRFAVIISHYVKYPHNINLNEADKLVFFKVNDKNVSMMSSDVAEIMSDYIKENTQQRSNDRIVVI
jgi:hypothetical protein